MTAPSDTDTTYEGSHRMSEKTPQPVVNTQLIAQGVSVVLGALVALGFITTGQSDALGDVGVYVIGGIPVVAAMVASFRSRKVVTPNAAPRDMNGEPLASTAELRATAEASFAEGKEAGMKAASEAVEQRKAESGALVTVHDIAPAANALTKEDS